jgi:nucleoside-diphosphate-sugar epimerase
VTGAAEGVGEAVARHLVGQAGVDQVIGLDRRRGEAAGVTWRPVDVTRPALAEALRGADALVHLAVATSADQAAEIRRDRNLRGANCALTSAAAASVGQVVLVTSAMVYGAHDDNPLPLADDAPLRAIPDRSVLGDWLEMEQLAARASSGHSGVRVCVLRPARLTGPGTDQSWTRLLLAPRLLMVKGSRPRWQFCHVDDLASAVGVAVLTGLANPAAVAADGWLEQEDVERITGLRRIELPGTVAFGAAERLHRIGVSSAPASELAYLTHPWVVAPERLHAAGWQPKFDNQSALEAHVALLGDTRRRPDRRDATRVAAGATVAVAGAVAVAKARAARRRRKG